MNYFFKKRLDFENKREGGLEEIFINMIICWIQTKITNSRYNDIKGLWLYLWLFSYRLNLIFVREHRLWKNDFSGPSRRRFLKGAQVELVDIARQMRWGFLPFIRFFINSNNSYLSLHLPKPTALWNGCCCNSTSRTINKFVYKNISMYITYTLTGKITIMNMKIWW